MTTCANCSAPLSPGARFCRACGTPVEETRAATPLPEPTGCPACGAATAPNARFCRACGTDLTGAAAAPRSRGGFTAIVVAVVLIFGSLGGGAAYLLLADGDEGSAGASADTAFPASSNGNDSASNADDQEPSSGDGGESDDRATIPDMPDAELEQEMQDVLLSFHDAVVAGRYEDAWEYLSSRKQRQFEREDGFAQWSKAQASLGKHLDPSGLTVAIDDVDPVTGVARVMVTGMGWSGPGSSCSEWSGLTWVKYEGGEWRYDPGYSTTPERERAWEPRYDELLGGSC